MGQGGRHDTTSFGVWVRKRRRSLDLTQAELAERVGCAEITIRKIESDARRPSRLMAERLAESLEIEPESRGRFIGAARAFISPSRLRWPVEQVGFGDSSVPVPLTSFVGRSIELSELSAMAAFTSGPSRLITLTGPPGVGKTRLAQELAIRAERTFDIPVVFVDLAPLTDPEEIGPRIATAVAVPAGPGGDRLELALLSLNRTPSLLILDNFEHLLEGAPTVTALLGRCPHLTCVVTSRVRLSLYGEVDYPVRPLPIPAALSPVGRETLDDWPAVQLFLQRAAQARSDLRFGDDLARVAEICRLVDGLPLAIELAAQRARHLPLAELQEEMTVNLSHLAERTRDRTDRQRSVGAAVAWSYRLLDADEQRSLRLASVFAGEFSADALGFMANLDQARTIEILAGLVDSSLVRVDRNGRYSMLAVVRSFAMSELESNDDVDALQRRFAEFYTSFSERASADVDFWAGDAYLETLDTEIDNIISAMSWAFGPRGDLELGRRLVVATGAYMTLRGLMAEGGRWAELAFQSTDEAAERAGPGFIWAECLGAKGDLEAAEHLLEQVEQLARQAGETRWLPLILHDRGFFRLVSGDLAHAEEAFDESLRLSLVTGSPSAIAMSHMRLGLLALEKGSYEVAERENVQALDLYREMGDGWGTATALGQSGDISLGLSRPDDAVERYLLSASGYLDSGFDWFAASRIENVGNALAAAGRFDAAAAIYGLADQWLADLGMPPHPLTARARAENESASRQVLGEGFERAHRRGSQLPRAMPVILEVIGGIPE